MDTGGVGPGEIAALQNTIAGLRTELAHSKAALSAACRPHFTVRADTAPRSGKIRVICIGDAHDAPVIHDKARFTQIGRYIRAVKPDVVIQIGDFVTLDSLNSFRGASAARPSFMEEMRSFEEALAALAIAGSERHCTLGNHENRLFRFEARAPQTRGMMQQALQRTFQRHGWTTSPYGQITSYGGVGFVHIALNGMSRPYGGKLAEQSIANDAVCDLVMGHSHSERRHRAPKLGGNSFVQIINVGCALPDNHMEEYAAHGLTGWSYGITDMTIQHGHVQDYRFVTMAHLAETYNDRCFGIRKVGSRDVSNHVASKS